MKQGTPEYENHIKNETKITNPDWNDLNKQKSNKQRSLDSKKNNNNDEKTQNRIKDNKSNQAIKWKKGLYIYFILKIVNCKWDVS